MRLLSLLLTSPGAEENTGGRATAVGIGESTVSHHLAQLHRRPGRVRTARLAHLPSRPADALAVLCVVPDPGCCRRRRLRGVISIAPASGGFDDRNVAVY
ncbi:hypothetical protein [Nocardia asteroides]|uniref:hypothetical protein n=1 Tax=Nocardia asteroides TaxID=1824 RepID=UPI0033F736F8